MKTKKLIACFIIFSPFTQLPLYPASYLAPAGISQAQIPLGFGYKASVTIDTRLLRSGLLRKEFVGYAMSQKNIINPDNRDLVCIYSGPGADIPYCLISTNAHESHLVETTRVRFRTLKKLLKQWDNLENLCYFHEYGEAYDYKKRTYKYGYSFSIKKEMKHIEKKILLGLKALGVDKNTIQIEKKGRGIIQIRFSWSYPGEEIKTYVVNYINGSITNSNAYPKFLKQVLSRKIDVYFQRAGTTISQAYENFLPIIAAAVKEDGYFMTNDNYTHPEGTMMDYYENNPDALLAKMSGFKFTRKDEISSSDMKYFADLIVKIRKKDGEQYNPGGRWIHYGWDLTIRRKIKKTPPVLSREQIDGFMRSLAKKISVPEEKVSELTHVIRYDCSIKQGVSYFHQEENLLEIRINPEENLLEQLVEAQNRFYVIKWLTRQDAETHIERLYALLKEVSADCVWRKEDIINEYAEQDYVCLAAVDPDRTGDESIVGFSFSHPKIPKKLMHLSLAAVDPACRNSGIAGVLWEKTLYEAKRKGYTMIDLYTNYDNIMPDARAARLAYRGMGFIETFAWEKNENSYWPHYRYCGAIDVLVRYRELIKTVRAYAGNTHPIQEAWGKAIQYEFLYNRPENGDDMQALEMFSTEEFTLNILLDEAMQMAHNREAPSAIAGVLLHEVEKETMKENRVSFYVAGERVSLLSRAHGKNFVIPDERELFMAKTVRSLILPALKKGSYIITHGTGSGLLEILAAGRMLHAIRLENDLQIMETVCENFEHNGIGDIHAVVKADQVPQEVTFVSNRHISFNALNLLPHEPLRGYSNFESTKNRAFTEFAQRGKKAHCIINNIDFIEARFKEFLSDSWRFMDDDGMLVTLINARWDIRKMRGDTLRVEKLGTKNIKGKKFNIICITRVTRKKLFPLGPLSRLLSIAQ